MVLEAFGGVPVTLKNIQIRAACTITSTPKILQLKISTPEGPLDPMEFSISSTTSKYPYKAFILYFIISQYCIYDSSVPWVLHCCGTVQRINLPEKQYPFYDLIIGYYVDYFHRASAFSTRTNNKIV